MIYNNRCLVGCCHRVCRHNIHFFKNIKKMNSVFSKVINSPLNTNENKPHLFQIVFTFHDLPNCTPPRRLSAGCV